MKSLLVQLDDPTYHALDRVAPAAERKRTEFIRSAIRRAIREIEEERMRLAYLAQPPVEFAPSDWSDAEPWTPADPEKWAEAIETPRAKVRSTGKSEAAKSVRRGKH